MELVIQKTELGVRWVAVGSRRDREVSGCSTQHSVPSTQEEPVHPEFRGDGSNFVPWIFAAVDPEEKWWVRLRGNPKRSGEISQAAFLLKAEMMGFDVALPWGDNQKFDFVVWRRDGRALRVQVKATGRLHRRGYEIQAVHTTRHGGKKRYSKRDIDVIAAHVQPVDAWYLIPIEKVGRAKTLRLYPGIERRVKKSRVALSRIPTAGKAGRRWGTQRPIRNWERWRDRWDLLG